MKYTLSILSIIVLLVTGCSRTNGHDVVVILVDKSGSTTELEKRNQKTFLEQQIERIPAGATAVVAPITANPLSGDRNDVIRIDLPGDSLLGNHDDVELKKAKKDLLDRSIQMLENTPVAQGTAILDSLRSVESAIPKDGKSKVTIVIISDMMEVTPRLDLYQACPTLTEQRSNEIVQTEADADRLPKLKGEVRIIGAGVGNKTMDVTCRDNVKSFWLRVIEAAGGTVISYDTVPIN